MRRVGIIGGLGPRTTADFYLEVIRRCEASNRPERPPILIASIPLPYAVEADALSLAKGIERYLPYLQDAARALERGGADFLVMPCNTVHAFLAEVRDAVAIPVLDIIEETAASLADLGVRHAGLIGSFPTIHLDLYRPALQARGIRQTTPDGPAVERIGAIIHNLVLDRRSDEDRDALARIVADFAGEGVEAVVLACTDLQALAPACPGMPLVDTMTVLAAATAREILREPRSDQRPAGRVSTGPDV